MGIKGGEGTHPHRIEPTPILTFPLKGKEQSLLPFHGGERQRGARGWIDSLSLEKEGTVTLPVH